jgi:hypothetical protein
MPVKLPFPEKVIQRLAARMYRAAVDFGYPDVTMQEIEDATRKALRGEVPSGPPSRLVIEMLIRGWMEDAKVIDPIRKNPIKKPRKKRHKVHFCTGYSCTTCNKPHPTKCGSCGKQSHFGRCHE